MYFYWNVFSTTRSGMSVPRPYLYLHWCYQGCICSKLHLLILSQFPGAIVLQRMNILFLCIVIECINRTVGRLRIKFMNRCSTIKDIHFCFRRTTGTWSAGNYAWYLCSKHESRSPRFGALPYRWSCKSKMNFSTTGICTRGHLYPPLSSHVIYGLICADKDIKLQCNIILKE